MPVTPAPASNSMPSGNGKKASEAAIDPTARSPACCESSPGRPDAALVAGSDSHRLPTVGQNHRIGLGVGRHRPREAEVFQFIR